MSDIKIAPQISITGVGLIREALITAFERGGYGKDLDSVEQVQVDTVLLVEKLDNNGCQIVGRNDLYRLEQECWKIINLILKDGDHFGNHDIIDALSVAREQLEKNVITKRLSDCQELLKYVNGYDCYDLSWDDGHPFDNAMDKALARMRPVYEANQRYTRKIQ